MDYTMSGFEINDEMSRHYVPNGTQDIPMLNCSLLDDSELLNSTNCTSSETSSIHTIAQVVMQVCYGLCFFVGLCGNSLVIYVIIRFSKMQTVTNLYILNLAIADELFVLGIPFLMITSWLGYWVFSPFMCVVYMVTTSLNQFTSSLFLTVMSADRYIAVCHPINAPKIRTPFISKMVSLTAWAISSLMIVPVFMYAKTSLIYGVITCNIFWPQNLETIFTFYSFVLAFGIPVLLFFIFYSLVLLKLRRVGPQSKSKEKKKSHRKVTKMVLTVITVYVICYLPYWVLQLVLIYSPPKQLQSSLMIILFLFSSCLSYANSAINPILYAFLSDNFKKSFLKACTCANKYDANSVLQFETSVFPRRYRKDSSRFSRRSARERKSSVTGIALTITKDAADATKVTGIALTTKDATDATKVTGIALTTKDAEDATKVTGIALTTKDAADAMKVTGIALTTKDSRKVKLAVTPKGTQLIPATPEEEPNERNNGYPALLSSEL